MNTPLPLMTIMHDKDKVLCEVRTSGYRQDDPPRGDAIWALLACDHTRYYGEDGPSTPLAGGQMVVCPECTHTKKQIWMDGTLTYLLRVLAMSNKGGVKQWLPMR